MFSKSGGYDLSTIRSGEESGYGNVMTFFKPFSRYVSFNHKCSQSWRRYRVLPKEPLISSRWRTRCVAASTSARITGTLMADLATRANSQAILGMEPFTVSLTVITIHFPHIRSAGTQVTLRRLRLRSKTPSNTTVNTRDLRKTHTPLVTQTVRNHPSLVHSSPSSVRYPQPPCFEAHHATESISQSQ